MWRFVRTVLLFLVGALAGLVGAAALLRRSLRTSGGAASDELAIVAILDGVEVESHSTAFRGGTVLAWFGGVTIDLTGATLAAGARLEIRAIIGGVAVKVPPDWRIEATADAFLGGVDIQPSDGSASGAPTLTVHATTVFGGVTVRP